MCNKSNQYLASFFQVKFPKGKKNQARAYSEVKPPFAGSLAWGRMKCKSLGWPLLKSPYSNVIVHKKMWQLNKLLQVQIAHMWIQLNRKITDMRGPFTLIPWQRCMSCKTCLTFKQGADRCWLCQRSTVLVLYVKDVVKMSGPREDCFT